MDTTKVLFSAQYKGRRLSVSYKTRIQVPFGHIMAIWEADGNEDTLVHTTYEMY